MLTVQKYGGSSVGTPEKIHSVAARIAKVRQNAKSDVVVVVSAMGDTTDELITLARKITGNPSEREMDVLLSAGERISMSLLSMALRDQGVEAISFTGSQAGIITDESHTRARIVDIKPIRVQEELKKGKVVIVAGFQGVSRAKEVTTLGRGGSDTTAVALATALKADRCEIWTDVSGIYSADPRVVPNAKRYETLPTELVYEMAVRGAQVMHARAMEIARERKMPLFIGNSSTGEGTMTVPGGGLELPKVVSVTSREALCLLRFEGDEQIKKILLDIEQASLLVHGFEQTDRSIEVLVSPSESAAFLSGHASAIVGKELSQVSVVGYQLQQDAQVPVQINEVLHSQSIEVLRLTAHSQSITVLLNGRDSKSAVRLLHDALITNASRP